MTYRSEPLPTAASAVRSKLQIVAALAVVALGATGCKHLDFAEPQVAGWSLVDPAQRHPILVSQQPETIHVRVGASARGLSGGQRAEVYEFVNRARASDAGNSRVVIQAPAGGDNEVSSMYAVAEIRQILSDNGFAESSIVVEAYHGGHASAPVRLSYLTYVAEAPTCGYWPTNLANQRDNANYPNFGCANQRNLAVMVANPADLIGPRTESDRLSDRRDVVMGKYVKGEHSGADKPGDNADRTDVKAETGSD
jgi:pilus assembly protein CpaD